ncbi:helix-turn-helix domain-containing protein [Pseudonocardia spinosispora]|uniref:helix-turn-helix domain-containing protein n=1 Tax=Pseudonocardia spinosispora TaxID=103441 RepID=UPI000401B3A7|nr:helix-turn-helix domain-containing protein [Pseudonocardia spinosispora]
MNGTQEWVFDPRRDPDAVDGFYATVAATLMPFTMSIDRSERRRGGSAYIRRSRFGDLSVVEHDVPDLFFGGSRVRIGGGSAEVAVTMMAGGQDYVDHRGRGTLLGPGDIYVVDGEQSGSFHIKGRLRTWSLLLPRAAAGHLADRHLTRVPPATARHRLLGRFVTSLAEELPAMTPGAGRTALDSLVRLLRLIDQETEPVTDPVPLRTALLPMVRRSIERRLGEPGLTPSAIASDNAISLRTLHGIFAGTGESVSTFVRRRRLENAHADLLAHPARSVTSTAMRWGFTDPGNFTRAFKAHFGLTPSDLRAGR